jgi:hypothetical protein
MIAPVVRKVRIEDQGNDFAYWQSLSPQARLAALEEIRREYHGDNYDSEQRFQRFFTIIKQK